MLFNLSSRQTGSTCFFAGVCLPGNHVMICSYLQHWTPLLLQLLRSAAKALAAAAEAFKSVPVHTGGSLPDRQAADTTLCLAARNHTSWSLLAVAAITDGAQAAACYC